MLQFTLTFTFKKNDLCDEEACEWNAVSNITPRGNGLTFDNSVFPEEVSVSPEYVPLKRGNAAFNRLQFKLLGAVQDGQIGGCELHLPGKEPEEMTMGYFLSRRLPVLARQAAQDVEDHIRSIRDEYQGS